jgi:UDP-N-acetylmuramoylalanine--D-glutamate ligase
MNNHSFYKKNVLIVGLARSGSAAAKLLHQLGANVTVTDKTPFEENIIAKELHQLGIEVICGGHPDELLDRDFSFMVKNPGIPYHAPFIRLAQEKEIPIYTEVEVASLVTNSKIIGITGTNGKTTTTTLIHEILKESGLSSHLAGNIGYPLSEIVTKTNDNDIIVCELSSFQLMGTSQFKPYISVLLNIFDAHLDYHADKQEYIDAKLKIMRNQNESDFSVFNLSSEIITSSAIDSRAKSVPFSTKQKVPFGAYIENNSIYFKEEQVIDLKDVVLPGAHNQENILAAISVAKILSVPNEAIYNVLTRFRGVEHRLQFVNEIMGRAFFNDSKATNILATSVALSAFEKPTVLLCGGLDRGNEFDELIPYLKNVKAMVAYGQSADKLIKSGKIAEVPILAKFKNLHESVEYAYDISNEGDVVLLSPACASWDQYKTFEERGKDFIKAISELKIN